MWCLDTLVNIMGFCQDGKKYFSQFDKINTHFEKNTDFLTKLYHDFSRVLDNTINVSLREI